MLKIVQTFVSYLKLPYELMFLIFNSTLFFSPNTLQNTLKNPQKVPEQESKYLLKNILFCYLYNLSLWRKYQLDSLGDIKEKEHKEREREREIHVQPYRKLIIHSMSEKSLIVILDILFFCFLDVEKIRRFYKGFPR